MEISEELEVSRKFVKVVKGRGEVVSIVEVVSSYDEILEEYESKYDVLWNIENEDQDNGWKEVGEGYESIEDFLDSGCKVSLDLDLGVGRYMLFDEEFIYIELK